MEMKTYDTTGVVVGYVSHVSIGESRGVRWGHVGSQGHVSGRWGYWVTWGSLACEESQETRDGCLGHVTSCWRVSRVT